MVNNRTTYTIVTKHPVGFRDGEHSVTVNRQTDGTRYVTGTNFGCSRDYNVKSDREAVVLLLQEHAMSLVSFKHASRGL